MVNFLVDDVDGVLAKVVAAGGKAVGPLQDTPYGRFGWFVDPDGNKVELWQPGPIKKGSSKKRR
jgi:predicted enzyme related to lactoylglutathione lyase